MATILKDGCYAFLGMAQPVERETLVSNGKKVYYAVLASVKNGAGELAMVLGRGEDLNSCVLEMKQHRDEGKKRSFVEGMGTLTFEVPTTDTFNLNGLGHLGLLEPLDFQDLSKAQVYLGLI